MTRILKCERKNIGKRTHDTEIDATKFKAHTPKPEMNQLYYDDNFHALREHIADESVKLIYLGSPLNSKRN